METKATPVLRKAAGSDASGAQSLPQSYIVSREVFPKEQERIFSRQWLCAGHESQIEKAGDYFAQEVAGESLILLRDRSGEARAFYNVCRHRGTRMCEERSGHLPDIIHQ